MPLGGLAPALRRITSYNVCYTKLLRADWRNRNLKERVELITPIEEPALQAQLIRNLEEALADNRLAWDLDQDGRYTLRYPAPGEKTRDFHRTLMKLAKKRAKKARKK